MSMKHPDLLGDNISELYVKYLLPSISATLVTSIYILADTVMIGRGVGAIGIAALNILLPLYSLFFGTGMLFGVGGGVLFSIMRGRGDEKGAKEYFTAASICVVSIALIYLIGFNIFFDFVTVLLGKKESMEGLVNGYGRILVNGAPLFVFSTFLQAFVRNDRAPKLSMIAVITGGVLNVILDYVFIFPMQMGMAGGAAATVIGSAVTVMMLLSHFFTPHNTLKLVPVKLFDLAGKIFFNGLSSFLIELSNGIVVFLFNLQLLAYVGDIGVVVYGIISNSALVVLSVCNGIAQAAQPLLATNYGAGKKDRVKIAKKLGVAAAGVAGFLFAGVGLVMPATIIRAFVAPTDAILALAVPAVRIYFASFIFVGFNILFSTYFQSVGRPGYALIICLLRGLLLNALFVFLLPTFLDVMGIWLTILVTESLTLLICMLLNHRVNLGDRYA